MKYRELYLLVHSLSKGEKQQLSNQLNQHSKAEVLSKIYGYFNRKKVFNEEDNKLAHSKIRSYVENPKKVKSTLVAFGEIIIDLIYERKRDRFSVSEGLIKIEIAFHNCLYEYALKLIEDLKKKAAKFELFAQHIQLINWQIGCIKMLKNNFDLIPKLREEYKTIWLKWENYQSYSKMLEEIESLQMTHRGDRENYVSAEILNSNLIKDAKNCKSLVSQVFFWRIKCGIALLQNNRKKLYEFSKSLIKLHNSNKDLFNFNIGLFIGNLHLALIASKPGDQEFERYLSDMENIKPQLLSERIQKFQSIFFPMTYYIVNNSNQSINEKLKALEELEIEYKNYEAFLGPNFNLLICSNFCNSYFFIGSDKGLYLSMYWCTKAMQLNRDAKRTDVLSVLKLVYIVISFEMKSYKNIKVRNVREQLKYSGNYYKSEKILLSFFNKLNPKSKTEKQLYKDFYILNENLKECKNDPKEITFFENFDFQAWSDLKVKQLS